MSTAVASLSQAVGQQAIHCNTASHDRALSVKVRLAYLIAGHTLLEAMTEITQGERPVASVERAILALRTYADNYREDVAVSGVFLGAVDDLRSLL